MYADEYGTDWTELEAGEAIERAYALGVAETLGQTHPDELDRLIDAVASAHDRSLVQLAYDEGRSRGLKATAESAPSDDDDGVWSSLVTEEEHEMVTVSDARQLPPALRSLPILDPPGDGLDRIRLPKFLTRR